MQYHTHAKFYSQDLSGSGSSYQDHLIPPLPPPGYLMSKKHRLVRVNYCQFFYQMLIRQVTRYLLVSICVNFNSFCCYETKLVFHFRETLHICQRIKRTIWNQPNICKVRKSFSSCNFVMCLILLTLQLFIKRTTNDKHYFCEMQMKTSDVQRLKH